MQFTVSLALEDFVPTFCAGIGFFSLADALTSRHREARRVALIGAGLVTTGGLSKATWKLVMALSSGSVDLMALDKSLFFFLASGFICLATAFLAARRESAHPARVASLFAVPLVSAAALMFLRGIMIYRGLLLGSIVIASTITLLLAIGAARRRGLGVSAALIAMYLVTGFILPMLARREQTVELQYVEQAVNTTGAIGLMLGSLLLRRAGLSAASVHGAPPSDARP